MVTTSVFNPQATSGQNAFHIAFGVDGFYVAAMAITILSIVDHNPQKPFMFHILVSSLPPADVKLLEQLAQQLKVTIKLHDVDSSAFAMIQDKKTASCATYYRLFLCDILKDEAGHVLYLDSDIVCLRALPPLPEMGNAVAAVVLDVEQADRNASINRPATEPYFNAGVLLINVKRWLENDISRKAMGLFATGTYYRFADQDVLNLALGGKIVQLSKAWNMLWDNHQADADTVFLHYAGQKPWLQWSPAYLDPPFAKYLNQSPWPAKRVLTPVTRKNKGQYARYLFKRGNIPKALLWYARFLLMPKKAAA